jgi:uncharacterized protein YcbK (DUF882 family)
VCRQRTRIFLQRRDTESIVPISNLVRILPAAGALRPYAVTGAAALILCVSSASLQTLVANGETRSLPFAHVHTGETITVTYKKRGKYDEAALKQINWFLRDWRRDEPTTMDPHLFDILWEVRREVGDPGPITIISAYRSPQTNSMLRARGRGVARYSQHMVGKAIDFYIPGADLAEMRAVGLRLQRGGVGFYPSSGSPFIHVDTGSVRHWPRMTRDQLARVFPDGKTVHLPTDGKPMPNYALALAEVEARGTRAGSIAIAALDDDDDDSAATTRSSRTRIPTAAVLTSAPEGPLVAPQARPVLASLGSTPSRMPVARSTAAAALDSTLPMPSPRPRDLGDMTASVPAGTRALGYAAAPARDRAPFGPIPGTHTRIMELPDRVRQPQTMHAAYGQADAANAPAALYSMRGMEFTGELHEPDLYSLRGLMEPVRAAIRVRFTEGYAEAPSTARFVGPAVVALQTIAFDRGAGILASRN